MGLRGHLPEAATAPQCQLIHRKRFPLALVDLKEVKEVDQGLGKDITYIRAAERLPLPRGCCGSVFPGIVLSWKLTWQP